jgi:hypothetical protein
MGTHDAKWPGDEGWPDDAADEPDPDWPDDWPDGGQAIVTALQDPVQAPSSGRGLP